MRFFILGCALVAFAGCSTLCGTPLHGVPDAGTGADAGAPDAGTAGGGECAACTTSADCAQGACVQIDGDDACALACTTDAQCNTGFRCLPAVSFDGLQVSACLPASGTCASTGGCGTCGPNQVCDVTTGTCQDSQSPTGARGTLVPPTTAAQCTSCQGQSDCQANGCYGGWWCDTTDGRCHSPPTSCPGDGSSSCAGLAGPDTSASCTSCSAGSNNCQANGCFGGWVCDTARNKCEAPPDGCASGGVDGGSVGGVDAGPEPDAGPIEGTVTATGGTVSRLYFAVVGDTRPPDEDQTSAYPTSVIGHIYSDIQALDPKPQFVLSTGDYMFANPSGSQGAAQIALYQTAMNQFTNGPHFGVMGNHECTGYTAGNCASSTTKNMQAYLDTFITPNGYSTPYFAVPFTASDNSWTAKLVVIACNVWDNTQKSWLDQQMSQQTTYTIVSRHEPSSASNAPCTSASDQIINAHGYDVLVVGHTHTFEHFGKEVVVGNGGAPLSGSASFGFATFEMVPGVGFRVVEYDASSAAPVTTFTVQ